MIKNEDIEKLAQLSRIKITEEEKQSFASDIESIVEYISEIKQVTSEEPTHTVGDLRNVMREDKKPHKSGVFTDDLLKEAPSVEGKYFKVKKILSQD